MKRPDAPPPVADGMGEEVAGWVVAWAARITQFAYTYTGSWPAAEDVAQETFLRLYQQRRRGKTVHPGWLFVVAHNLAVDASRRARYLHVSQDVSPDFHPSDQALLVRDMVDRLPRTDQQVLWLFYYAGYSVAETAATLGLSPNQVKNRLYHARERFRKAWRDTDE